MTVHLQKPLRVLIVPDKFKGTLTASEAAEAIARGWRRVRPRDILNLCPMSDGGDGFGSVTGQALHAEKRTTTTVDAAHRPLKATWWWVAESRAAIIESAQVIGLAQLPPGRYHPFELDTTGLASTFQDAAKMGARRCWIGIGGSATNDAGFGLARALGWSFWTRQGTTIERWTDLCLLTWVESPPALRLPELHVAVDVRNTLLGVHGASRVYGPQKGLTPADFPLAERCFKRLRKVMRDYHGLDMAREPGTGAAGGLGFGLRTFLNAKLESGFEVFASATSLRAAVKSADLVLTGEGAIDASTVMGKGVGEVARLCQKSGVPCYGLGGGAGRIPKVQTAFTSIFGIVPDLTNLQEAKRRPAHWLEKLGAQAAACVDDEKKTLFKNRVSH
jgi:glycerate 2-kinase